MAKAKEAAAKPAKEAKVEVDIIRGRMPVAIAAAIKLVEPADAKDSDLAAKYRTTNGKISDIRADRNFAYIKKGFKPTKEMVALAKAYATECEGTNSIMKAVKSFGIATEAEAEKFLEGRKGARKTPGKPKEDKGKGKGKAKDEPEPEEEGEEEEEDLDDLLD